MIAKKYLFLPVGSLLAAKWPLSLERTRTLGGILLFSVVFWLYREPVFKMLALVKDRDGLVAYLETYGMWGPALLVLILVLQIMIAAIPGHIFMVTAAYLYGFTAGFILALLTTVLASQLAFWVARWAGRPWVERMVPPRVLDHWDQVAEEQGAVFFMFTFMLPIFPSDVMNFVAGLSSVSGRQFFWANLVGRLPGVILMGLIGSYGFQLPPWLWITTITCIVGLFVAWRVYTHISKTPPVRILYPGEKK